MFKVVPISDIIRNLELNPYILSTVLREPTKGLNSYLPSTVFREPTKGFNES